jgi:hypothetical protein
MARRTYDDQGKARPHPVSPCHHTQSAKRAGPCGNTPVERTSLLNPQRPLGLVIAFAGFVLGTWPMFGPQLGGWHVPVAIGAMAAGAMLMLKGSRLRS